MTPIIAFIYIRYSECSNDANDFGTLAHKNTLSCCAIKQQSLPT